MGDGLQQQLVNKPAPGCGVGQIVIQSSKLSQMLLAGAHFDTFLQKLAVTCPPHVASRSPDLCAFCKLLCHNIAAAGPRSAKRNGTVAGCRGLLRQVHDVPRDGSCLGRQCPQHCSGAGRAVR